MKVFVGGRRVGLLLLVGGLLLGLVACTPDAEAEIISPQLGEQLAAKEAGLVVVAQPTPEPVRFAELSEEQIYAGLPAEIADAISSADPANGQTLTQMNACIGCHSLEPGVQLAGPTWVNIADVVSNRLEGVSPAEYLYDSIVNTNAVIVDGYTANVMPQNFGDTLSDEDLADIISFLLTFHE